MGLLSEIQSQWTELMGNGGWSEDFVFTLDSSYQIEGFAMSGIFYSGTSDEDSPAQAYAPKKAVRKEAFQIALAGLPSVVTDPKRMLQGAVLSSASRGTYKVREVRGEKSGTLTLMLNPSEASA